MKILEYTKLGRAALAVSLLGATAEAAIVAQYSFEGNADDTAASGVSADDLTYRQGVSANGAATFAPGISGQAAVLDGSFFDTPSSVDLNITSDWTIEAFINISNPNAGWERIVTKWGNGGQDYHFALRNGNLSLFEGTGGGVEVVFANTAPPTNLTDGEWHHVAVTSSPAGGHIAWVDGEVVASGAAIALPASNQGLGIGDFPVGEGDNNALRLHGLLDEVLIHDEAVDQSYVDGRALLLIPEPSSFSLMALAVVGFLARRRR